MKRVHLNFKLEAEAFPVDDETTFFIFSFLFYIGG